MCEHGRMLDLGEMCSRCPGPRDRRNGMVASATCPLCGWRAAIPSFSTDNAGYTVTMLTCAACGFEYQ